MDNLQARATCCAIATIARRGRDGTSGSHGVASRTALSVDLRASACQVWLLLRCAQDSGLLVGECCNLESVARSSSMSCDAAGMRGLLRSRSAKMAIPNWLMEQ